MYGINWQTFIEERTPSATRKPVMFAWLHALLAPVKTLHTSFLTWRDTQERDLRISPQVRLLRFWLNEFFDVSQRRFEIEDYENTEPILIWGEAYNDPVYLPEFLSSKAFDFLVIAPCAVDSKDAFIRSFLDKYKLAGKRYKLVYRNDDGSFCSFSAPTPSDTF